MPLGGSDPHVSLNMPCRNRLCVEAFFLAAELVAASAALRCFPPVGWAGFAGACNLFDRMLLQVTLVSPNRIETCVLLFSFMLVFVFNRSID